ncbi:gliding motility-associated C-terminal domain-containing protein [Sphingobacterium sp. UBA7253]
MLAGLTYQKIRLFEIYNRFGQKVFSGTGAGGWNGTQNGLPCEMGTYHYLIVLDYPDGKSKTFKGDVLLLR